MAEVKQCGMQSFGRLSPTVPSPNRKMHVLRNLDFQTVLEVFSAENSLKDSWYPGTGDTWPRNVSARADSKYAGIWRSTNLIKRTLPGFSFKEFDIPEPD